MQHPHLFGPVNSRRLGISLGVDIIPLKTCTLDCVYCECGATTNLTAERLDYISSKQLIEELGDYLSRKPILDYITFAGSGEPTLNSALDEIILFLKNTFPTYKTALLTNGSLFHIEAVRETALHFDLVAPSFDAIIESSFKKINRPHPDISLPLMIESLITFSHMYYGTLLIEIFIVPGINDTLEELAIFKNALQKMKFTRIQLNSLDRPGTDRSISVATSEHMQEIAQFFHPLPVEIISRSPTTIHRSEISMEDAQETVISILRRRPSTMDDLLSVTTLSSKQIKEITSTLELGGMIRKVLIANRLFFQLV